jgi:hypothetical protein
MADPTFKKMARITTLAPDWLASNFRLGEGAVKALRNPLDPRGQMYLKGIGNFLATYGAANMVNKYNTGKYMWQNPPGNELSVSAGQDKDGKQRYFEPYGTAMDMIRLPMAIAHAALSGDASGSGLKESAQVVKNHLNPIPHVIYDMISNQDQRNQAMYGKNYKHRSIPELDAAENVGSDIASHTLPIGADAILDWQRGKISNEELAEKLFQAPISLKNTPKEYR